MGVSRDDASPAPRRRDRIAVVGFCALWLVPLAYRIVAHAEPPLPRPLASMTAITCLFTKATPTWNAFYVQARTRDGGPWVEVDTSDAFSLRPFGNRDRLHRFLVQWSPAADDARAELAAWLYRRERALHPDAPVWIELRFVGATIAVREDRPPQGAWRDPPLHEIPETRRRILSTHPLPPEVP